MLAYTLPLHNPVRLDEEASMLDHVSSGRQEVGVGLGHRPDKLVSLGVEPAQVRRTIRNFAERMLPLVGELLI